MNASNRPSIHNIAYVAVFLLIISVIVYLNLVFQQNLKNDIAHQFSDQQLLLARGASLSIEKHIDNYVKHLVTLAQLPSIRDMEESRAREQILKTIIDEIPREEETIVNFQLIDKRGIIVIDTSTHSSAGMDISDREYFAKTRQLVKGEVNITNMLRMKELSPSKRYIVISTPLYKNTAGGPVAFNGAALFAVSVDDIAGEYVSQIRIGKRGYAWVMDSHGTLVYHPTNPEMIGRNLLDADESCYQCHRSFDAERKILAGVGIDYGLYTAPMGEDKLISFSRARVGSESWIVCVTAPFTEVTSLIAKSMKLYSWLISIIFFTVIGTSVFFIVLIKKKTAADERAKYASELEVRIKERTSELSREKEKLHAILSGFGAAVSLIDRNYKVLWANEVVAQNVKYPVGKMCYAAYRNRTSPCQGCPLPAALASGRIETAEMACRRPGVRPGAARDPLDDYITGDLLAMLAHDGAGYFQFVIAPIKDKDGNVTQVVELIQDVTGIKRLEQSMMHSEKLAALGRISAGIAHEIGNPLTSIYSFIQILQENRYDSFTNNTLDTISFHINRIKEIVQQMSGFSRSYTVEKGPVDMNDSVRAALDLLGHEKGMKGCQLFTSYFPEMLIVTADEKWLVSVFVNLIINALDAMPGPGRLTVRTCVEEVREGCRRAVAEVSDTGVGIPHEDIEKIFDPFYTTKQSGKGTGLGLAVTYSIIKDLGGDISVVSQPGEGTTFTIKLPLEECFG
ncbi:MAG: cache domain-containing protein [Nitrospirae bacterium]|nr:cache domain-containing protein [Nitrospirota bacterium]